MLFSAHTRLVWVRRWGPVIEGVTKPSRDCLIHLPCPPPQEELGRLVSCHRHTRGQRGREEVRGCKIQSRPLSTSAQEAHGPQCHMPRRAHSQCSMSPYPHGPLVPFINKKIEAQDSSAAYQGYSQGELEAGLGAESHVLASTSPTSDAPSSVYSREAWKKKELGWGLGTQH